jgi:flagellar basal-body rod protein FlgG
MSLGGSGIGDTSSNLDIAINGEGYMKFLDANGKELYSRDGCLRVSSDSRLMTVDGYTLADDVQIPWSASDITIDNEGQIRCTVNGVTTECGAIRLYTFKQPDGLKYGLDGYVAAL